MVELPIYLDNHATTQVDYRVVEAMLPYFTEKIGNAASINHTFGWDAADAVESAREQIAALLHSTPKSLIFTSGATEANNIALKGVMKVAPVGAHLITNAAEHRSVLDPVKRLQRSGIEVTTLAVDQYGLVDPQQVAEAIQPNTVLVSIMFANNEVGSINPIAAIGEICRENEVLLHCDAVQAVGKIPVDLSELPIDLLSLSAHKIYGPKGVGALYIRKGSPRIHIEPLFDGGGHENHLRSGTLPVPLIVGLGKSCQIASEEMSAEITRLTKLRDQLWLGLNNQLDGIAVNGHPDNRLAGNLNISIEDVDGEALMMSMKQIAVSSGSACTSANPEPSHVLRAMGVSDQLTRSSLRFGLGRFNTAEEVDYAVEYLAEAITRLRDLSISSNSR